MTKLFFFLVACLLMSCGAGYVPPASTVGGPAMAPSVAIESAWEKRPNPETYVSEEGSMRAVHTNSAIGGAMYFEIVPTDGLGMIMFAKESCENLADDIGYTCSSRSMTFDAKHEHDDPPASVYATLTATAFDRKGELVIRRMLGEKTRYLACTGSWSTYGNPADRAAQHKSAVARLHALCKAYSSR